MPQGVELAIPFPSRISPDFERAKTEHLIWARSFGLISTDESTHRHLRANFAELGARFHPAAVGADLDLAVDQESWYFLFDDLFDGPRGEDPETTRRLTDAVAAVLDVPPSSVLPNSVPIVRAFTDLWQRSCEGMSPAWRERAARHWRTFLEAYLDEAAIRHTGIPYSAQDYLALRRSTGGVQPVLDLAERVGHFEVPELAFYSDHLTAMRRIAAEVVTLDNDICSVEKEEARGEVNSLVLILERERRCSRAQSIEIIREMIRARTDHFLALERALPQLYDVLELADGERWAIDQYSTNGLRAVMRGCYDWDQQSGRYTSSYIIPAGRPGYLEDLSVDL